MGIDISIQGIPRKDYLARNIWRSGSPTEILEGDDWMCLKNFTFLERLIVIADHPDKEVMSAYKGFYYELSKPFRLVDLENAVERLKQLDKHVKSMPFCPAGWEWMNEENKAILKVVQSIYEDEYGNFVFPWDDEAKKPDMGMGSWRLQEILNRAIVNAKKLPEDTVFFIWWC